MAGESTYVYYDPAHMPGTVEETVLVQRTNYLLRILESYPTFGVNGFVSEELIDLIQQNHLLEDSPFEDVGNVLYVLKTAAQRGMLIREPVPGKSTFRYYRPENFGTRQTQRAMAACVLRPVAAGE